MTRHLLVVCSANVCRSPIVAALFRNKLATRVDIDGENWLVTSAGTGEYDAPPDPSTLAIARSHGLDLDSHRARVLTPGILEQDGADLVLAMTRGHLPSVVGLDPSTWPRTFTLKELARKTVAVPPATASEGFVGWRERVAAGRLAREMMRPDPADDVADPYGLPRRQHEAMFAEVSAAVEQILAWGPWQQRAAADSA